MNDASLTLPSRDGVACGEKGADGYVVDGRSEWLVEGAADAIRFMAESSRGIVEKLTDTLLLLNFGNAVGFFDLPGLGRIDVISGKWTQHDFDQMLLDLVAVASALPFASGALSALPYDRSIATRDDVLYHAFVYLRYILSERGCA